MSATMKGCEIVLSKPIGSGVTRGESWLQRVLDRVAVTKPPHGLPLVQCGPLVSAEPQLRQELINCFRASPVIPLACVLQSFIRCC